MKGIVGAGVGMADEAEGGGNCLGGKSIYECGG